MANPKNNANKNTNATSNATGNQNADREVNVLYQRLGSQWFAFSEIDGEVYYTEVSNEEVAQARGNTLNAGSAASITVNSLTDSVSTNLITGTVTATGASVRNTANTTNTGNGSSGNNNNTGSRNSSKVSNNDPEQAL